MSKFVSIVLFTCVHFLFLSIVANKLADISHVLLSISSHFVPQSADETL